MLAGREALRISRIAAKGALPAPLFVIIAAVAIAACALASWLAGEFAPLLTGRQKIWFVAAAMVLAALEVIVLRAPVAPREPTRSLGAIAIVLLAGVLADASGLLILSLGVATAAPLFVAAGGALAVAGVLGAALLAGRDWEKLPLPTMRWATGIALLLGAFAIALLSPDAFS